MISEKEIEQKLVTEVMRRGGLCPKFVSPGLNGVPDRIVLLPDGKIGFVELKAPGKTERRIQTYRRTQLTKLGFKTFVLDDPRCIGDVVGEIDGI